MSMNLSSIVLSIAILLGGMPSVLASFADKELRGSVAAGGQKQIQRFYLYQTGPCRGFPPPQWTSEGAKLGKVTSKTGNAKISNGPCGADFEYPYLDLIYNAGSEKGVDSFKIYIHNGGAFTPIPVVVTVGSGAPNPRSVENQPKATQIKPPSPKASPQDTSGQVTGSKTWLLALTAEQGVSCSGYSKPLAIKAGTSGQIVGSISLNNAIWKLDGTIKKGANFEIRAISPGQTLVVVGIFEKDLAKGFWKSGSCSGNAVLAEQ